MIADALEKIGISIISIGDREIRCHCPVHKDVKGHVDTKGKFYVNNTTGLYHCFSCHAGGSLPYLVELLGGDYDGVAELMIDISNFDEVAAEIRGEEEEEPEPEAEAVYISERLYNKNPRPGDRMLERRDLDRTTADKLNIRWDLTKKCWLLPVYDFGFKLLGWQEKSKGYFNNHPEGLAKRGSLFGFQGCSTHGFLVVVESPLDAARFQRYEFDAVAIYGSYASNEQLAAIADKLEPRTVVLAFDNDEAGDDANATVYRRLSNLGIEDGVRFFRYPSHTRDQDPGDLDAESLIQGARQPWADMPRPVFRALQAQREKNSQSATSNGRAPFKRGGSVPTSARRRSW